MSGNGQYVCWRTFFTVPLRAKNKDIPRPGVRPGGNDAFSWFGVPIPQHPSATTSVTVSTPSFTVNFTSTVPNAIPYTRAGSS